MLCGSALELLAIHNRFTIKGRVMHAYFESSVGKNTVERNVQHCAGCTPPDMNVRVVLTDIHGNSFIGKRTVHVVFGDLTVLLLNTTAFQTQ